VYLAHVKHVSDDYDVVSWWWAVALPSG